MHAPTLKCGTYTHLSTTLLDPHNKSAQTLLRKGLTFLNCFAADMYPRRVMKKTKHRQSIRKVFKQFVTVYEDLYRCYRQLGGQVTIIFGKTETLPWHRSVCRKDKVKSEKIYTAENKQFSVWIERVSRSRQVINISFLHEFELCLTQIRYAELLSMPVTPDIFYERGERILT